MFFFAEKVAHIHFTCIWQNIQPIAKKRTRPKNIFQGHSTLQEVWNCSVLQRKEKTQNKRQNWRRFRKLHFEICRIKPNIQHAGNCQRSQHVLFNGQKIPQNKWVPQLGYKPFICQSLEPTHVQRRLDMCQKVMTHTVNRNRLKRVWWTDEARFSISNQKVNTQNSRYLALQFDREPWLWDFRVAFFLSGHRAAQILIHMISGSGEQSTHD